MSNKIIGIDLGTTNSAAALLEDGVPTLIRIEHERILPSVVGMSPQDELIVGTPARNQWVVLPERTISSIKRKVGSNETVEMAGKTYTPQEISAFILRKIKNAAEAYLKQPVERAVITVPAYFTEVQRQATIEAGQIAGLTVERIINEPTAAALAHSLNKEDAEMRALVYDLGGGTFDVSIIELNFGVVDVQATAGNNELGGDDFDRLLAEKLAQEFEEEHGIDLTKSHKAWARLLRAAEEAKIELSDEPYSLVSLEYIAEKEDGSTLHIRREVKRYEFEELIKPLLESTIDLIEKTLEDAELEPDDIEHVLLVGGSTRIPLVREMVADQMEQDAHAEIDPDAAVALGAAAQGGIISGEEVDAILVDVTPFSLGIETVWYGITGHMHFDHFSPLIHRNSTIPKQKSEVFSTARPNQDQIEIKVYQGERAIASENTLLGKFMVEDLKPNRADGHTDVTVNFKLDINGILEVTVIERKTGKKVSHELKAVRQRLSPLEIAKSQAKLEEVEMEIEMERERDDQPSKMDAATVALLDRAQKALDDSNVDEELKEEIQEAISAIRQAAVDGNEELVEEYGDDLVDLLFEAEE